MDGLSLTTPLENTFKALLGQAKSALDVFMADSNNLSELAAMAEDLASAFTSGGQVLICGNGGSACDAMHFAEELTGRYRDHRRALPAISLTEPGHLTCTANDYGFEAVFARGVEAYARRGDIFIGLSTSGNSKNILAAVEVAREKGSKVFLFLGKDGGLLREKGDRVVWVKEKATERIQEIHMMALHILIEGVERKLFPELYIGSQF
jgi:D-sedoheptulose 7-phosphate isomerase